VTTDRSRGSASAGARRAIKVTAAMGAVVGIGVASWISWVAIGLGPCGGSGGTPNTDPRRARCVGMPSGESQLDQAPVLRVGVISRDASQERRVAIPDFGGPTFNA
jgi:hypothetical protein